MPFFTPPPLPLAYGPVMVPKWLASSTAYTAAKNSKKATKGEAEEDLATMRKKFAVFRPILCSNMSLSRGMCQCVGGIQRRTWLRWYFHGMSGPALRSTLLCGVLLLRNPTFYEVRTSKPVCQDEWSVVAKDHSKLEIAITRVLRLETAGLTLEMVGSVFLARLIGPLEDRKHFAWEYAAPANIMHIRFGLTGDFTSMELTFFRHHLFHQEGRFILPSSFTPLYNNSH
ncbi:hypothetical protein D1007_14126 [Hordeum vulgare]|nr:hypothetical protein D1007_14126 [Hordeum vulgare]